MTRRVVVLAAWMLASLLVTTACSIRDRLPGRPTADSQVIPPTKIVDFNGLYASNCAGCHGPDGKGGAAIGLGDPVYLAIADDATIRRVTSDGVPGTAMPAFAQHSGGTLTDDQINVIVGGIRARWAKPDTLRGATAPPYSAQGPGDPKHGATVYSVYCSSCHGSDGRGSKRASSIVDGSFLALVSDQSLRTTVIVGRPDMGAPDWRGGLPGKPMSPDDVTDVVAWLAAQRPQFPGQPYSSAQQNSVARSEQ
ncbi:MAG: cytochrome c, class [Bryobacterales bacterium]|jgi:cytochrome c oxidase cbb3-type subunit 3|nr:cytochrome c, class [Bryobacterales bacterium]